MGPARKMWGQSKRNNVEWSRRSRRNQIQSIRHSRSKQPKAAFPQREPVVLQNTYWDCIAFGRPVKCWVRKRRRKPPDKLCNPSSSRLHDPSSSRFRLLVECQVNSKLPFSNQNPSSAIIPSIKTRREGKYFCTI